MKLVTISEAKATLSGLIEAAEGGEEILIMRGSHPAVTLTPVSEENLVFWPKISESALEEFDLEIKKDRKTGNLRRLGKNPREVALKLGKKQ